MVCNIKIYQQGVVESLIKKKVVLTKLSLEKSMEVLRADSSVLQVEQYFFVQSRFTSLARLKEVLQC